MQNTTVLSILSLISHRRRRIDDDPGCSGRDLTASEVMREFFPADHKRRKMNASRTPLQCAAMRVQSPIRTDFGRAWLRPDRRCFVEESDETRPPVSPRLQRGAIKLHLGRGKSLLRESQRNQGLTRIPLASNDRTAQRNHASPWPPGHACGRSPIPASEVIPPVFRLRLFPGQRRGHRPEHLALMQLFQATARDRATSLNRVESPHHAETIVRIPEL